MISEFELGWLVGLLEGEGSFYCDDAKGQVQRVVALAMTDRDIVTKYKELVERITDHTYTMSEEHRDSNQAIYRIRVRGQKAIILMQLIVSYMGKRRRERVWQCINGYKVPKITLDLKQLGLVARSGPPF